MQMDDDFLARELARTIVQFRRIEGHHGSCHGLRKSEFMLLGTVIHCLGPDARGIKISDLSARLQITPAGVTQMINSLEEGGYVERLADAVDRRVVLVSPTDKGRHFVDLREVKMLKSFKGLVSFLGARDSKELIRLVSLALTYFWKERQGNDADKFQA